MKDKNAWNSYSPAELEALDKLSKGYIDFISEGKTERECTDLLVKMAEEHGYRDLNEVIRNNETLDVGSKVYAVNMHKSLVTFNIGEDIVNHCTRQTSSLIWTHNITVASRSTSGLQCRSHFTV